METRKLTLNGEQDDPLKKEKYLNRFRLTYETKMLDPNFCNTPESCLKKIKYWQGLAGGIQETVSRLRWLDEGPAFSAAIYAAAVQKAKKLNLNLEGISEFLEIEV